MMPKPGKTLISPKKLTSLELQYKDNSRLQIGGFLRMFEIILLITKKNICCDPETELSQQDSYGK